MLVQNTYNGKIAEYNHIDDIHESAIRTDKLNSTALERELVRVHVGKVRRIRNNHAQRLAQFKIRRDATIK